MRYFSTNRPVGPGTYPKSGVSDIHNFDDRQFCSEIGRMAWGYIDYDRCLPEEEVQSYELVPEGRKIWHCVVSSYYDDGRVVANIVSSEEADEKPENSSKALRDKDVYIEWFDDYEKAEAFVEAARRA